MSVRALYWLVVLLALAGLPAQPVLAQFDVPEYTPATLAEYITALQAAQQALAEEKDAGAALEQAQAELAPIRQVLLASGLPVTVEPLLGEDQSLSAGDARARIATVLAQLQAASGDDTAARLAVLEAVLAGPQFVTGESWFDRLLHSLAEWWARLLPEAPSSPGVTAANRAAGNAITTAIGIAGAIALVLLLAYWLRGLLRNFIGDAQVATAGSEADDLPQTPAEARQRAADRAASGDYRDAVRNLYLSALLTLEQNGLVPADRSLTNRELLARVAPAHPVRLHLQPVVETFDDVWYGVHVPDDQTYATYTHSVDELEALAQRPPAKEVQP